jgi:hypothetical protein
MIKGHSGSGSRNVDSSQAGPILKLSDIGQSNNRQHPASASGVPPAANTSSGPRSAGSSAASSPQSPSPRCPPGPPPNTLYHPPPPQQPHYSPTHSHSQHSDQPRYPHVNTHVNTSYTRDHPPRSGSDMIPYSPISPDMPTPATATSTNGPAGHTHGGHGHGHGHGDLYNTSHSPGTPSYPRLPLGETPNVNFSHSRSLPLPPPPTSFYHSFRSPPTTQFPGITSIPRRQSPPRGAAFSLH